MGSDENVEQLLKKEFETRLEKIDKELEIGFKIPSDFMALSINSKTAIFEIPTFLYQYKPFKNFYLNIEGIQSQSKKYSGYSRSNLVSEKEEIKNQLKLLIQDVNNVFSFISSTITDYVSFKRKTIIESDKSFKEKLNELDFHLNGSLTHQILDLVSFYGVKYTDRNDNVTASGIIFGSNINELLKFIQPITHPYNTLNRTWNFAVSDFSIDQRQATLKHLIELKKKALPLAKDFLVVQRSLKQFSTTNKLKPSNSLYGTHSNNRDWIISEFNREFDKQPSQNKTVEAVQNNYHEKFGLKIAPITILRYNGKAD